MSKISKNFSFKNQNTNDKTNNWELPAFSLEDSAVLAKLTNELNSSQDKQQNILLIIKDFETKIQQNLQKNQQNDQLPKNFNLKEYSNSLISCITSNREKRDKITKIFIDRNKKVENTRKDLSDRKFRFERFRDQIQTKEQILKDKNAELEALKQEIDELNQKNSELKYNLRTEEQRKQILQISYDQKNEELQEKENILAGNKEALEFYEKRAAKHIKKGEQQIEELKELITNQKNEIQENEETTKHLILDNQKLNENVDNIKYDTEDIKSQLNYIINYTTRLGEQRQMFMKLHKEEDENEIKN